MKFKVRKIGTLTEETYNKLHKNGRLGSALRELLNIPATKKMKIGDSLCVVGQNSKQKEVYSFKQENGKILYAIVIRPIDEERAFCYTIYPEGGK